LESTSHWLRLKALRNATRAFESATGGRRDLGNGIGGGKLVNFGLGEVAEFSRRCAGHRDDDVNGFIYIGLCSDSENLTRCEFALE
jgi:hypothetical protein